MMIYKDYPEILANQDSYKTDPFVKLHKFLSPTFNFYLHEFRIIQYANRKAKKGLYDDFNWTASSLDIIHSLEKCGVRFEIDGMNNLKTFQGTAVFVANHMSTLETFVLPSLIQPIKPIIYVIKKELATYPLFGPVARARNPIVVGRENPREDLKIVMEEGSERLKNGKSIIIFPQKTRSLYFDTKSFNTLGIKLAKKNDVYVVPIALITDAWGNGKLLKDFGKIDPTKEVKISFGKPFKVTGNGQEDHQNVIEFISGKFRDWGKENFII